MKVVIAEKPSVARDIARVLGVRNSAKGYMYNDEYSVTWAFGHLIQLAMPEDYGYTRFDQANLPIIPAQFKRKIIQKKDENGQMKNDPGAVEQLHLIKDLFLRADEIIVATDAGREGELIFRYIYAYSRAKTPFKRLWISSMTDKAILEGFANLEDGTHYDNLYKAGRSRGQADWLVGINATQALTIKAGGGLYSLGRVQTPTLRMICERYIENTAFVPQPYWQVRLMVSKQQNSFSVLSVDKFQDNAVANAVFSAVSQPGAQAVVKSVEKKHTSQDAPLLYDLTNLQKDANTKYSLTAEQTLQAAQFLYEHKVITYPRTGSRYISDDVLETVPQLCRSIASHPKFGAVASRLAQQPCSTYNKKSVDAKKVTDHHALLLTENTAMNLPDREQKVYDLIARRMLEAFMPKCEKDVTTLTLTAAQKDFTARGEILVKAGWREVAMERSEDDDSQLLPELVEGEVLDIDKAELLDKMTKPRPLHTENSLLAAMETAGRELDDEEAREAMKNVGLGTPATRAAIIETLVSRNYIIRDKKSLVPTHKGLAVYNVVKDKIISDPQMTGKWENALLHIERGTLEESRFSEEIVKYTHTITAELLNMNVELPRESRNRPHIGNTLECPYCKQVSMNIYPKLAECQNPQCGVKIWRTVGSKLLTDNQIKNLVTKGTTGLLKGFTSMAGKKFDAEVQLSDGGKTKYIFPPREQTAK